ncbi:MAG TPA: hypothetical protein VGF40_05005 [Thermoanaerobaculia bacterium]
MADDRKARTDQKTTPQRRTDEPQSYGSQKDWLEGTTAQTVEGTPHRVSRHDEAFYDQSLDADRDAASAAPAQQNVDTPREARPARAGLPTSLGGKKIAESNETRQSYFRKRDYD